MRMMMRMMLRHVETCFQIFESCLVYFKKSNRLQLKDSIHLASLKLIVLIMLILLMLHQGLILLILLLLHDSMLMIHVDSHLTFKRERDVSLYGSLDLVDFKANCIILHPITTYITYISIL